MEIDPGIIDVRNCFLILAGEVTVPVAAEARGLIKGGLKEPAIGESTELKTGSNIEDVDMLGPRPEMVLRLASGPE